MKIENLSMEQVVILIQENALEEMELRAMRLERQIQRGMDDLDALRNDIRAKRFEINSIRDQMLVRGCV